MSKGKSARSENFELTTDTVSDIDTGDVLSVNGEIVCVLGTWIPPILTLPELKVVRADGQTDELVIADVEVGFRSNTVDDEFPDDARVPTEHVTLVERESYETYQAIRDGDVVVTDSRDSPIHPNGEKGTFEGAWRCDGMAIEVYHDSGETSSVDDEKERYAEPTYYAYVRDWPEPDTAKIATFGRGDDVEYVERTGLFKREDKGKFGALCGKNGFAGWYTASEVAQFVNAKAPDTGTRFGQCHSYTDHRVEWHDDGHNAKAQFTRIDD